MAAPRRLVALLAAAGLAFVALRRFRTDEAPAENGWHELSGPGLV